MALAPEGIYFASLKGDALKGAGKLMKNCTPAAQALGEKAIYIPWDWITSIDSNKRLCGFKIHYYNNGEILSKALTPAGHAIRDEIFEAIVEYLHPTWKMTTTNHTPVTATFFPLGCIAVEILITVGLAILSYFLADQPEWHGVGRGAALAGLLNLLRWMGPIWTGVVGLLVAMMLGVWLVVRIAFPPIELSLRRKPEVVDYEED